MAEAIGGEMEQDLRAASITATQEPVPEALSASDTSDTRLIIHFELEELIQSLRRTTDRRQHAVLYDRAYALHTQWVQTFDLDTCHEDRKIQLSIYEAMLSDFPEVDTLLRQEATASQAMVNMPTSEASEPRSLREDGRDGYFDD